MKWAFYVHVCVNIHTLGLRSQTYWVQDVLCSDNHLNMSQYTYTQPIYIHTDSLCCLLGVLVCEFKLLLFNCFKYINYEMLRLKKYAIQTAVAPGTPRHRGPSYSTVGLIVEGYKRTTQYNRNWKVSYYFSRSFPDELSNFPRQGV